jgi:hypothetical protein
VPGPLPCRHLARKHQLYGSGDKEMAHVDMLIDGVEVRAGGGTGQDSGQQWCQAHSVCVCVPDPALICATAGDAMLQSGVRSKRSRWAH